MMTEIRVLLIDDDPGEQKALAGYLREVAQFKVKAYAAGGQALEHLRTAREDYTAVLLDYVLKAEEMSGRQLLSKIREEHPYLPVIVFTGLDPARGVQALSEGACRYLRKPLDHAEVVNIVRNLAEQEAIFRRMAQDVRQMLGSDMCLAWRLDRRARRFRIVAWDGDRDLDAGYRRTTFLDLDAEATHKLFKKKNPIFISDVRNPDRAPHYLRRDYAAQQGWTSLISIPLLRQDRIIGLVDSYTYTEITDKQKRSHWLQVTLPPFARQAAESAWSAELSDRLQALQGLTEVLAETFEEGTILQQILAKGIELVGAEAGWVYRLDVNKGGLVLKKGIGVTEDQIGPERGLGEGITGRVAQTGQALNVPDVTTPPQEYQHLEIPGLEVRSEVAVPLRRGEQIIGALAVTSPLPDAFTAEDVSLLSSLAAQAAVAIGHADVTRHSQELGRLALTGDYERLAQYVVEAARDLTGADVILWMMGDEADIEITEEEKEKGPWLRVKTSKGNIDADYLKKAKTPTAPGSSLTALALERGQPVIRRDIWDETEAPGEPRFHNLPAAEQHGWRAFMAVPLLGRGKEPLGSLSLYGQETAKFGEAEVGLMQTFAGQIVTALQSIVRRDMLLKLNQIGQELSLLSASSPSTTLPRIAELALKALEADTVDLYQYRAEQDKFDLPPIMIGKRLHPELVPKQIAQDDVVARIVNSKKPIFASDAQSEPILTGEWETDREERPKERFVIREKILSSAGIPLVIDDKVVGVLFVGYRRKCDFGADAELTERVNLFAYQAAIAIGNARLLETVQSRNQVMARLLEVGPALGKLVLPRTKTALSRIALSLCDQLGADSVVIYPYDPQRPGFWDADNVASYGLWQPLILVDKPREKGLPMRIREDKWVEVSDVSHSGVPTDHPLLEREGIQAFVGTALQQRDQELGVLYVNYRTPHCFSEEDRVAIRRFAKQAAETIAQAAQTTGPTLPGLLEDILYKAKDSLMADLVILHRYHQGRDEEFVGRPIVAGKLNEPDRMMHKPLLTVAPRQLIERGEAYYAEDVSTHEFYTSLPQGKSLFTEREGICSACGVPLKAENECVGALFVNYRKPHKFDDNTKQMLQLFADQVAVAIRNARMLAQTQALQEVAEQLGEFTLRPQMIFGLILERALDLIGFSKGWISVWNKTTDILEMKAARGLGQQDWKDVPSTKGITGYVARSGKALRVDDVHAVEFYEEFFKDTISELCVPITYQNEVLGVLNIESARAAAFSQRDEELLTTLASQAAIAIHNVQVLDERRRESQSLKVLHDIGKMINAERKVRAILDLIVPKAIELIGMDSGIVYLVDMATMQITDRFGYPESFTHPEPRISKETGLTRTVLLSGEPIVIENALEDERVHEVLIEQGVRSMVAWPIQRGKNPIGVLFLNGMRIRRFADWEQALLDALSEQVAIAIENARLVRELEERIADLARLRELSEELSAGVWLGGVRSGCV